MVIITDSYLETQKIGYKLAKYIKPNSVILLDGDLATGKTTFTQGLAKGLGVNEQVNSPSFVIMKGYEGKDGPFFHLDLYRLDGIGYDFDLEEYYDDSVAVIEWPYQVKELLPKEYLLIKFTRLSENERKLEFLPVGKKYIEVLQCIDL